MPHQGHAPLLLCAEEVEPWLNTQWQTEKLHVFLAEDGHIFLTCLQLVGTWVKHIFRNLVPYFVTCPQLVGTWVKKDFQEFGPRFLACHVIFGVSCSKCCVSWRVNINRVNNFRVVSYQNSACQHVHAMSGPP